MRRHRIILTASLLLLAPVVAGCSSFDLDKFDVFKFNEQKKLPGDRKPLFPEGVPGVSQGVPSELIKGNQPAPETAAVVVPPAPEPEKPKPAPAPKKRAAAAPARAQPVQQPRASQAPSQAPWPEPQQQQPQSSQAPWPSTGQQPANDPWPATPPSGTFSR